MRDARREGKGGGEGTRRCELPRVGRPPGKKLKEVVVGARGPSLTRTANNNQQLFTIFSCLVKG